MAEHDVAGVLIAKYAQGTGIDEPLAMWRGGALSYYHADGLGSITSLTDGSGSAVAAYTTDSFGKSIASAGTVINGFRYTGREWDQETGLYYYRARYYDSNIGRFLSEDPIRLSGINFYAYVGGRATNAIDPQGLDAFPEGFWGAWDHYCDGTGLPWTVGFSAVNWGDTQNNISIKIKGMVGGGCSKRRIPVNFDVATKAAGKDEYVIGRHTVKVLGTIQVNCDCTWSFNGDMSSRIGYDPFDFNPSDRGLAGETAVFIGRNRCPRKGKPFNINLPGSISLSSGGKIQGKSTCPCNP